MGFLCWRLKAAPDRVMGEGEPNPGLAAVKNPVFEKQQGKRDGYFLLMECRPGGL